MTECQFHNNCGGWCESGREQEHNLCEHCLEAHDEEMVLLGTHPLVGASSADWEQIRQNADRYLWLRRHSVRIQGSEMWYQGAALDIRVDVGRDRTANQAKQVHEGRVLLSHQSE